MLNNKYLEKVQPFIMDYFKNNPLSEISLTKKHLILISSVFFVALTVFKNYNVAIEYIKQSKEIKLSQLNLINSSKMMEDLQVKYKALPENNIKLFDEKDKSSWEQIIKVYSITLSQRLKLENKTVMFIKSFENKPSEYINTALLEVKIDETLVPMSMRVEIALFLAQFGDIKKYHNGLFEIYVTKKEGENKK